MTLIENIAAVARIYCAAKKRSASTVSRIVFGDGTKLGAILSGKADLTTKRYENTLLWFSDNWPENSVSWPNNIPRPDHDAVNHHTPIAAEAAGR